LQQINPLDRIAFPPGGTVLFTDKCCSDALSLISGFHNLVPARFVMVCRLEGHPKDDVGPLLIRLLNLVSAEHIAILISQPISSYLKQIRSMTETGLFDIIAIYGLWPNDDISKLGKLSTSYRSVSQFFYQINDFVGIAPTFLPTLFNPKELPDPQIIGRHILNFLTTFGEQQVKSFAVGTFSESVREFLESNRSGDSSTAALLIDRSICCSPLFMNCGSRFDQAAALDLISVLRDREPINHFLNGTFETFLSNISSCGKQSKQPEGWWQTLNQLEKKKLSKKYSSLPFLFPETESEIEQWELMLLEDCPVDELLNTMEIDFVKKVKLLAFVHCFGSIDVNELIGKSDKEKEFIDFLSNFSSGVKLAKGKSHTIRELLLLPQLIRSIVDPQMGIDIRIKEQSAKLLGKMFGSKRTTLKDYEKVYVFVFGGISFLELREIRQICAKGNPQISIKVISDTICSSMSILSHFSG
jgi:hypothetical protein